MGSKAATKALVAGKLRAMGLGETDRNVCLETFRVAGEEKAMEQAQSLLAYRKERLAQAQQLARKVLGLPA